jgi:hypothetical protein
MKFSPGCRISLSCKNIRLGSDGANPLRRVRNWLADGDGCIGLHLMQVSCDGLHGWKRALVRRNASAGADNEKAPNRRPGLSRIPDRPSTGEMGGRLLAQRGRRQLVPKAQPARCAGRTHHRKPEMSDRDCTACLGWEVFGAQVRPPALAPASSDRASQESSTLTERTMSRCADCGLMHRLRHTGIVALDMLANAL